MTNFIKNTFKKKSRAEVISKKVEDIIHDILILDFSNAEIAIIIDTVKKEGKSILENRELILKKELSETLGGINLL